MSLSFSNFAQDTKQQSEENKEQASPNATAEAPEAPQAPVASEPVEAPKSPEPSPIVEPEKIQPQSQSENSSSPLNKLNNLNINIQSLAVGLVLLGLGIFVVLDFNKKMPSDNQMDLWINEDIDATKAKALKKIGIDESELVHEQIAIVGPRIENQGGADWLSKKGKDNVIRYSLINVTILSMTANQIIAYNCCLDITSGNQLNESTDEYFYKDVVSVSTKTSTFTMKFTKPAKLPGGVTLDQMQFNSGEKFVLSTSGGTSIEVFLKDDEWQQRLGGQIWTLDVEKAVQAVRKMLREKKA